MKKLLFIINLFSFANAFSQINPKLLYNDWYLCKTEMKDGSKPFLKPHYIDENTVFTIRKNYFLTRSMQKYYHDFEDFKVPFNLVKDEIISNKDSSYKIEKLTLDSLIITKNLIILKEEKFFEKLDTLIIKNDILSPIFKNTFFTTHIRTKRPENPKIIENNFRFKGYIIFDNQNKKIDIKITDFNPNDQKNIDEKLKIIRKYKNWEIVSKSKRFIKLPFAFISFFDKTDTTSESWGEVLQLYAENYDQVFLTDKTYDIKIEGNKWYKEGVIAFQKNQIKKAADCFKKSFEVNIRMLDSYYNYAIINYENLKNKNEACKIWKFLKDNGQKEAEAEYNQKCINK